MSVRRTFFPQTPPDAVGARYGVAVSFAPPLIVCRACGAGASVPAHARFCPRCGATLRADAASGDDVADAFDRLAAIRQAEQALPPPPPMVGGKGEVNGDTALPPFARLAGEGLGPGSSRVGPPPVPPPLCRFHSDVLAAYAMALFRLGRRYERGHGGPRNPAEAIRCYCKSARLGNRSAAVRLGERQPESAL